MSLFNIHGFSDGRRNGQCDTGPDLERRVEHPPAEGLHVHGHGGEDGGAGGDED